MTDSIKWGEPIAVHGKRPDWLPFKDEWQNAPRGVAPPLFVRCADGYESEETCGISPGFYWWDANDGDRIVSIRLPADHFAYKAIAAMFEPWGGGDKAPADWDGGEVLKRCGARCTHSGWDWDEWQNWNHGSSPLDIIGYHKRAEAPTAPTESPMTGPTYAQRETAELVKENDALRARVYGLLQANNELVAEKRAANADADRLNGALQRMIDRWERMRDRAARAETAIAAIIGLDPARPDVRQEFAHLAGGAGA